MNESSNSVLIFTVYEAMGSAKNIYFIIVLTLYLASIIASATVMLMIYLDTSLHKPMYIFLFTLIGHGIIGSSAIWPKVMNILLTNDNTSSYAVCLVQVFSVGLYGGCSNLMLTVMAYDRYVSIFKPLQYYAIMNPHKVRQLILIGNLFPLIIILALIYPTERVPLCRYTLDRIFCDNLSIADLSCENTYSVMTNIFSLCAAICLGVIPVFLVILSYIKIISLIVKMSADARRKTFATCSPHLITFSLFSFALLFSVIYNRVISDIPASARVIRAFFIAPNYILIPPLLNPVVYGLRSQEIRQTLSKFRKRTVSRLVPN